MDVVLMNALKQTFSEILPAGKAGIKAGKWEKWP